MKRTAIIVAGLLVLFLSSALSYLKFALPDVGPPPDIKVEMTPENIARGKYLANSVAVCMDCHASRDWSVFGAPPITGTKGKGGERFDQTMGFPGVYYSRNITPNGIGDWSDGEIFRAITTGVSKDGSALFPVMPYLNFGRIAKEDVLAIIAYLRSLQPIDAENKHSESDFPMNFIVNTMPSEAGFGTRPTGDDPVELGQYLVTMASCGDCHTPFDQGKFDMSKFLAGGRQFQLPGATLTTPNLTPDNATGIGLWDEATFVQRFKAYEDSSYVPLKVNPGDFMTIMPWQMYATMEESDLKAIYAYLRSLDPIEHKIEKFVLNEEVGE